MASKCELPEFPKNEDFIYDTGHKDKLTKHDSTSEEEVLQYLLENGSCEALNPNIVEGLDISLHNITHDESKLLALVSSEKTLNVAIHQNIACLISSIIKDNPLPPTTQQKIRNWFKEPEMIGDPSSDGYALKVSFKPKSDLFVIKAARESGLDNLSHEAVAGMYVANLARQYVPNFMYVYGYTKCSRLIIDDKVNIQSWCDFEGLKTSYLITENVKDSKTIGSWILDPKIDSIQLSVVLYQIFNALNITYAMFGYVHNDLHQDNILVRDFSSETGKYLAIPSYKVGKTEIEQNGHVLTQYIPYIIDYGRCTFSVGKNEFWYYKDRNYQTIDIYRIVVNLWVFLKKYHKKNDVYYEDKLNLLGTLFSFFGEGTVLKRTSKVNQNDFFVPAKKKHSKKTIEKFFDFHKEIFEHLILSKSDIEKHKKDGFNISYPMEPKQITNCDFYDKISTPGKIINTVEYSNTIQSLKKSTNIPEKKKKELLKAIKTIDLLPMITEGKERLVVLEKECKDLIKNGNLSESISTFFSYIPEPTIQQVNERIFYIFRLKEKISEALSIIDTSVVSLKNQTKKKAYEKDIIEINVFSKTFDAFYKIYFDRKSELMTYERKLYKVGILVTAALIRSL